MKLFLWEDQGDSRLTGAYGQDGYLGVLANSVDEARRILLDFNDKLKPAHDAYDEYQDVLLPKWYKQEITFTELDKHNQILDSIWRGSGIIGSYPLSFKREITYSADLQFCLTHEPKVIELDYPRILVYHYGYEG
jgi:hypothetical protein